MTNSEMVIEIFQSRQADALKLFSLSELDQMAQKLENISNKSDKEKFCGQIIDAWNARVSAYNERVAQYNYSIYNGTHPALGKGIISDFWDDLKDIFR